MRGAVGVELAAMPAQSADVTRCECRAWVWFSTDAIGRTVENCDGCGYHGPQRTQSVKEPWTPKSVRRAIRFCARSGCGKQLSPRAQVYCSRLCTSIATAFERGNQTRGKPRKHHRRGFPIALQLGKNDPHRDSAA